VILFPDRSLIKTKGEDDRFDSGACERANSLSSPFLPSLPSGAENILDLSEFRLAPKQAHLIITGLLPIHNG
jgi:hypothetical protein